MFYALCTRHIALEDHRAQGYWLNFLNSYHIVTLLLREEKQFRRLNAHSIAVQKQAWASGQEELQLCTIRIGCS